MLSLLILYLCLFFSCFFLSFLSIPPPSAYLDDEEDEDPFGDYVISKSHLTLASLRLLGPTLGFCVIVFDVLLCPLLHLSVRDLLFCL